LTKSEIRNDASLRRMNEMVEKMSLEFGHYASSQGISKYETGVHATAEKIEEEACKPDNIVTEGTQQKPESVFDALGPSEAVEKQIQRTALRVFTISNRRWKFEWSVGTFTIDLKKIGIRMKHSLHGRQDFLIVVTFTPRQSLTYLPGVSMLYSTAPNEQGYYQLSPSIAVVPIIPEDHVIWDYIEEGNFVGVQHAIEEGLVHPRSQDVDGFSLLHVSHS